MEGVRPIRASQLVDRITREIRICMYEVHMYMRVACPQRNQDWRSPAEEDGERQAVLFRRCCFESMRGALNGLIGLPLDVALH